MELAVTESIESIDARDFHRDMCDVLSLLSRGHIFPEILVTAMPKTRDASVERNRELVLD